MRLGFALADRMTVATIRAALGPWAVSTPAVTIAQAAFADRAWFAATKARLTESVGRLDRLLTDARLRVLGGTSLFLLVESGDAEAAFERLGRAGVFVRRFSDDPDWLRFGIPGEDWQWQRLARALSGIDCRRGKACRGPA